MFRRRRGGRALRSLWTFFFLASSSSALSSSGAPEKAQHILQVGSCSLVEPHFFSCLISLSRRCRHRLVVFRPFLFFSLSFFFFLLLLSRLDHIASYPSSAVARFSHTHFASGSVYSTQVVTMYISFNCDLCINSLGRTRTSRRHRTQASRRGRRRGRRITVIRFRTPQRRTGPIWA